MLEHSDGPIAMTILGSARGSRAGFGGLANHRIPALAELG